MENTMKYLIKFLAIIGLVSMSHVAVAIDFVSDGDILEAAGVNEVIDHTNANTDAIDGARGYIAEQQNEEELGKPEDGGLTPGPVVVEPLPPPPAPDCDAAVGDTGPGGGLIFVVTSDGCRGLEAAENDTYMVTGGSSVTNWGCETTEVGAYLETFGGGSKNTGAIIAAACTDGLDDAADLAYNLVSGTKDDWYLPSLDEAWTMYDEIGPGTSHDGNFNPEGFYWTSTEDGDNPAENVYIVNFANGSTPSNPKTFLRTVRAVRIFDVTP